MRSGAIDAQQYNVSIGSCWAADGKGEEKVMGVNSVRRRWRFEKRPSIVRGF
jgi:hypothetical protein